MRLFLLSQKENVNTLLCELCKCAVDNWPLGIRKNNLCNREKGKYLTCSNSPSILGLDSDSWILGLVHPLVCISAMSCPPAFVDEMSIYSDILCHVVWY